MSSFIDFLWQGSPPPDVTNKSSSYQSMPDWYQAYQKGVLAKGNAIAAAPYPTFPGPRVAGMTQDQTTAFNTVRDATGAWKPALQQGAELAATGGGGFNQADFNNWKSPYIDGVVNRIAELGGRNLTESILPGVNETFTGTGQFGSKRHGEFTNRAVRDTNESIMGQQALALQQAQDSAMGNYSTDLNRKISAGNQMGALAQQGQQMNLTDAAALESAGQAQQGQAQKNYDLAYNDFTEQRDYPKNQTAWLSQLLGNSAVPTSTQNSSTGPGSIYQPSGLSTLAGLYSLSKGFRKGGRVTGRNLPGALEKMREIHYNG